KYRRTGIDAAGTTHDDSQIVFGESALQAFFAKSFRSRPEIYRVKIDCAGARHDRIAARAQVEEQFDIAFAAEGNEPAVGRGEFAVGGHCDVDERVHATKFLTDQHSVAVAEEAILPIDRFAVSAEDK